MKNLIIAKPLTLCVLQLAVMLPAQALADAFEVDGIYYATYKDSNSVGVKQNPSKYSGDITIPSTVEYDGTTYAVTTIGEGAFAQCTSLTSINIPESVTSIQRYAFTKCI